MYPSFREAVIDALRHPDLRELARSMRATFDQVLEAEHAAAVVAHRRCRELRDLLLELEDRQSRVVIRTGGERVGPLRLSAVGIDHVLLGADDRPTIVPLWAIDLVETVA